MKTETQPSPTLGHLSRGEILETAGAIEDAKVAAIEASATTRQQLKEPVAWASGESDVMGHERLPLSGVVEQLYEILTDDEDYGDERD